MKHGDLSAEVAPRIVIVFEGIVGILPDPNDKKYLKAINKKLWAEAIRCWKLDGRVLGLLWHLTANKSLNIEVCTWLGPDMAEAIRDLLDEANVPVRDVWSSTPAKLSRELAYLPDIIKVYDPDPNHVFTYGGKGEYVTTVSQIGRGLV